MREFFVAPGFILTYKLFVLKSFRSLEEQCAILRSPQSPSGHLLSTIGFTAVLVFPTLMSANFEISDHVVFFFGVQALAIGHILWQIIALLKLILKFRTVNFIQILISKTLNRKKNNYFFLFEVKVNYRIQSPR